MHPNKRNHTNQISELILRKINFWLHQVTAAKQPRKIADSHRTTPHHTKQSNINYGTLNFLLLLSAVLFVLISAIIKCLKTKSLSNRSANHIQTISQSVKPPTRLLSFFWCVTHREKMRASFLQEEQQKTEHNVCPIKHWQNGFLLPL